MNARSHKSKSDAIPEQARDWFICFTQFNGKPGRSGPYTQAEAEHRMRSTHWSAGSAPRYERNSDGKRRWPGDKPKPNRKKPAYRGTSPKENMHRADYLAERSSK